MEEQSEKKHKLGEPASEEKGVAIPAVGEGPGFFARGKLKPVDIMKEVIVYLKQDKYEDLTHALSEKGFLQEDKLRKFFLKKGVPILSWALNTASSGRPLRFLAGENSCVPKDILPTVLQERDFTALCTFLRTQAGMEDDQTCTLETKALQIEKFKILLQVDSAAMEGFMQKNSNNPHLLTKTIQDNFEQAREQLKEDSARAELRPIS